MELVRSNFTFHTGDLQKSAFGTNTNEFIQQANVGIKIKGNLWIDAGYFLTHIGAEGLLPKDNWLSSHSLVTYFEPFYQAGVRCSYEGEQMTAQLHLLNGNGLFDENNYNKTLGWFFSYTPNKELTVSYAGVAGNEESVQAQNVNLPYTPKTHILHNIVAQFNLIKGLTAKVQLDYATKSNMYNLIDSSSTKTNNYTGAALQIKYDYFEKYASTFRISIIENSKGVYTPMANGYDLTLGMEYKPYSNSFLRLESRYIKLDNKIFNDGNNAKDSRMELILNMGVWID